MPLFSVVRTFLARLLQALLGGLRRVQAWLAARSKKQWALAVLALPLRESCQPSN